MSRPFPDDGLNRIEPWYYSKVTSLSRIYLNTDFDSKRCLQFLERMRRCSAAVGDKADIYCWKEVDDYRECQRSQKQMARYFAIRDWRAKKGLSNEPPPHIAGQKQL